PGDLMSRWTRGALCIALAAPAAAQDSVTTRSAKITYLTSASAYVDAGREQGLREGDLLDVIRAGAPVARLRVAYLASGQSACEILTTDVALAVGDSVRYAARSAPAELATDSAARPLDRRAAARAGRPHALRGRIGLRYLYVRARNGASDLSQPSLDLRLDGHGLGGTPFGLSVDLRTRRTATTRSDGSSVADGRTRVYQAAVFVSPAGSPFRLTVGRQFSPSLASLSLFDGVLAEVDRPSWGVAAFGGSEPDPADLGYSSAIKDFGAYFQLHARPASPQRWSVTLGGIASYDGGSANRQFAYLQAAFSSRRLSVFATQEVDYYGAEKQALGEPAVSFTSSFATLRFELASGVDLHGGVDNRRSVRLYRDVVNPEIAFDDAFRRGVWGGLSLRLASRYRLGFDARSSTGGTAGRAEAYTAHLGVERLTRLGFSLRGRGTRYANPAVTGWLGSLTLGADPVAPLHLELTGGLRQETDPLAIPEDSRVTWFGAGLDLNLGRAWYLMLSATRETGGIDANDQLYGALSYRF
ncbi:MAG TPA: hypothetical protein VFU46_08015, partial [Gemmatimonadales bacterium]|nr:hypothetical protein [Gemmatimonadales bacterium]